MPRLATPQMYRSTRHPTSRTLPAWLAMVALAWAGAAHAEDHGQRAPRAGGVPAAYTQECAACHTAYPPGLLPAKSWARVMGGLDKHYGVDAWLDAATVQQLSTWLQANAVGVGRRAEEPPQDRITKAAWFERKHRGIDAAVWRAPSVKSAANCAACHTGAAKGEFDEDGVRIPAGLDAKLRRSFHD